MAKEIERKFLVDIHRMAPLVNGQHIQQGYLPMANNSVVRVRILGESAYLTLKGQTHGFSRSEFEYAIPVADAQEMIAELCEGPIVDKTRYNILHEQHTWEVDIFHGDNEGLIVAEIELSDEKEKFTRPEWVMEEVTGDVKYYNSNLLKHPFSQWREGLE